jgi:hypothetical protein
MAVPTRLPKPSRSALLLTLLLVWAVGLRVWYGSTDLHLHRFWDEKFSVPNVYAALEEGSLKPERYAYLRLTYLPQVAVLGALGVAARVVNPEFSWFRGEILTPAGFMICRSVQALIGGLSILLTFLVGRRLFSATVGLLAAFLVAASSTHLVLSAIFKPDILAVTTTLVAFLLSLRAVDRPTLWRYVLAGLGIGLAISSKPTAGVIAIPLTLAALILGFRDRRHWLGLMSAGVTSVLLFVALNPYPRYLNAFALQRKRYNAVAAQKGTLGDPLTTLHHELVTVFQGAHGRWIGAAAIAGLLLLGWQVWKQRGEAGRSLLLAMFLIYPVSFVLLYSMVTQNVLPQNFLPLLPFTSLAAAVFLVLVWQRAADRWEWLSDRRVVACTAMALVALVSFRANAQAYRIVIPTTLERAAARLAAGLPSGPPGWVRLETEGTSPEVLPREPGPVKRLPRSLLVWGSPRLTDVGHRILDRADALVFPLQRLGEPDSDFYSVRLDSDPRSRKWSIESRAFHAWGPDLVVVSHPWKAQESRSVRLSKAAGSAWFEYRLAGPQGRRQIAAIGIWLPRQRKGQQPPLVRIGGRRVEVKSISLHGRRMHWTTDRFPLTDGAEVEVRIRLPKPIQMDDLSVEISRWEKAG